MSYDPRAHGADCDHCILHWHRVGDPVPAELNAHAFALVVAEAPGEEEVERGKPLVGASGMELARAMQAFGVVRGRLSYTNAVLCRPPGNDMKKLLGQLRRTNERRRDEGKELFPQPHVACRPRLVEELKQYTNVIALGGTGFKAVTGSATSILEARGSPVEGALDEHGKFGVHAEGHKLKVLPTVHPAFVLRMRRWTKAFQADLGRAYRWFTRGKLDWRDPSMLFTPTPEQLARFLLANRRLTADVETEYLERVTGTRRGPTEARLRCIGIGTPYETVIVPFLSVDGFTRFYSTGDEIEIRRTLKQWLEARAFEKWGHNFGYYDRMVVERAFDCVVANVNDTILYHRGVEAELPHTLAYAGSVYTDVHNWKAGHTATEAANDNELWEYCCRDVAVTSHLVGGWREDGRAVPNVLEDGTGLPREALLREQQEVVRKDHLVQAVCVDMHRLGVLIDQKRRHAFEVEYRALVQKHLSVIRSIVSGDFNPNSVHQLRKLLFRTWRLPAACAQNGKPILTESGDPSTADGSLLILRRRGDLTPQQVVFLDALRKFRKAKKVIGTYLVRLRPRVTPEEMLGDAFVEVDCGADENGREIMWDALEDDKKREFLRGLIHADGRLRADWNCHTPKTGRLSSSNPNVQNWPGNLREMMIPEAGHVFVGADMDQIELRLICASAGANAYLQVFKEPKEKNPFANIPKGDPHALTAAMVFGQEFTKLDRSVGATKDEKGNVTYGAQGKAWDALRTFVKRFCFDSTTEILTPRGWVPFPQLTSEDDVAQYWPETRAIDFVRPLDRQVLEHNGPMVHVKSKTIDLRVTPDHRCLLRVRRTGGHEVRAATDYIPDRQQIQAGVYVGGLGVDLTDDELRLVVAMQADGAWCGSKAPSAQFIFSKERKIERMRALLARLNVVSRESVTVIGRPKAATRFGLGVGVLADKLWAFLGKEKHFGPWILQMTRAQLDVFVNEIMHWDGHTATGAYRSWVPNNLNWVQVAFALSAQRATVCADGTTVLVQPRDHTSTPVKKPALSAPVNETVYCVTVPSSFVVVRRNGKVSITGNCYGAAKGATAETLHALLTSVENDEGTLIYEQLTLQEVKNRRKAWLDANPEIEESWETALVLWRKQHYLTEPVWGRRLDFLDGEDPNEIIAYEAQAGASAIVNDAMLEISEQVRPHMMGRNTGLLNQTHDSMTLEVPIAGGERVSYLLGKAMTRQYPCYPVDFTAKPKIGKNGAFT